MKKIKILLLIPVIALIGCNSLNQNTSSETNYSASFSSFSSSETNVPKDVKIFDHDTQYDFSSFYFAEYKSELTIQDGYLYFGLNKLSTHALPFALFAADINHDGYRELLYEYMSGSASTTHTIVIYDLNHNKELFKSNEQKFGSRYMHRFGLLNDQLMINLCPFDEFMSASFSVFDYSPIVLNEQNDLVFNWQNKYGIESLTLICVKSDDEVETITATKIDNQDVYEMSAGKTYKFTIKMNKLLGADSSYPESDFAISVQGDIVKHYGEVTHENGVYNLGLEFSPCELAQITFLFIDFSLSVSLIVK